MVNKTMFKRIGVVLFIVLGGLWLLSWLMEPNAEVKKCMQVTKMSAERCKQAIELTDGVFNASKYGVDAVVEGAGNALEKVGDLFKSKEEKK